MKTILITAIAFIIITITVYSQTINGKFIRFGADSVIIKTETDVLNLPVSKELIVIDNKGQKVSPASLFENANITIKYEDGVVKSIVIDNQFINYVNNQDKPEYQLLYRETNYNYSNFQAPSKVSYVGYLPMDYQSILYPPVDIYNAKINYYSYMPVNNSYTFGGSESMATEIKFYDNLLANNYYSPRYYYETMSSIMGNDIPNYYYISQIQEKSKYYYKKDPTNTKNDEIYYYANNTTNNVNNNYNNSNNIFGTLVEVNQNKLIILSDRTYEIELNNSSNIFVKKEGKYIPLYNKEELKNLVNKKVELNISSNNNKLIANTIIINNQ
ncbi:MAG: hypothetical protein N2169_01970 [bacterium]|nr:hypothetical protein [bacterium]